MSARAKSKTVYQLTLDPIERQSESLNSSAGDAPVHDEIPLRAYCTHVKRGGQHGCELEDWLQAERALTEAHPFSRGSDTGWAHPQSNDHSRVE